MQTPEYFAQYHQENKEKRQSNKRRSRLATREWMNKIKDVPCADCGGTFPPECMDFDHVYGTKKFNIGQMIHAVGRQRMMDEIAKCDVVCANCHRIRTSHRRIR